MGAASLVNRTPQNREGGPIRSHRRDSSGFASRRAAGQGAVGRAEMAIRRTSLAHRPQNDTDAARHGRAMRFYLLLGILFIVVIWDIAQNRGQTLRVIGAGFSGFLRAIGLL